MISTFSFLLSLCVTMCVLLHLGHVTIISMYLILLLLFRFMWSLSKSPRTLPTMHGDSDNNAKITWAVPRQACSNKIPRFIFNHPMFSLQCFEVKYNLHLISRKWSSDGFQGYIYNILDSQSIIVQMIKIRVFTRMSLHRFNKK